MALERRIRNLEKNPKLRPKGIEQDPLLEYEITKERFDRLCVNLKIFYGPPSGQKDLLSMYFSMQDVEQDVEEHSSFPSSNWYRIVLEHLLKYPHRLAFDLANFGLGDMLPKVLNTKHVEYKPRTSVLYVFENDD